MIALRQLFEFASKDVVHTQRLGDLLGNVAVMRAPGIQVRLLQQQYVCLAPTQKLDDSRQL